EGAPIQVLASRSVRALHDGAELHPSGTIEGHARAISRMDGKQHPGRQSQRSRQAETGKFETCEKTHGSLPQVLKEIGEFSRPIPIFGRSHRLDAGILIMVSSQAQVV